MAESHTGIVFLSHPQERDTGDYIHRVTLPAQALSTFVPVTDIRISHPDSVSVALKAELLVVTMVADPLVASLIDLRRQAGLPTAFEISDDFADFPPNLPAHAFYAQPQVRALITTMARQADLMQCSSHGLLRKYASLNPNHVVFANQLAEVPALMSRDSRAHTLPVLGWSGSAGHLDDARRLAGLLRAWWCRRGSDTTAGPPIRVMSSPLIRDVFEAAGCLVDYRPSGDFKAYLDFLGGLDIGFAVIGDSDFSAGRSDGKFLELASRGVVCVASDAGEYPISLRHGDTGLLFADEAGFFAALDALFADPDLRERLRSAAHAYVGNERTPARGALERLRHYLPLMPQQPGHPRPDPTQGGADALPARSGGLTVMSHASETAFLAASALHNAGQLEPALAAYLQILEQRPDFHLPWQRCAGIALALGATADAQTFGQIALQRLESQVAAALSPP